MIEIIVLIVAMVVLLTMTITNVGVLSPKAILLAQSFLVVTLAIAIYYFSLVYRARKYMIEEVLSGHTRGDVENYQESM